jgi:beta-alanine--pyruvate transaminase
MGHAESTLHDKSVETKRLSLDEYWMPFTPNRDFKADPKMIVRAEGMYYWNDRGEKLIDASSGLFCCAAGHGRKEIAEAVGRQLAELDFSAPFLRGHPKQFELATRVAELTPGDLNRIFFGNSGSEAVESAMKVALAYHQARGQASRTMFVSRERAYHGVNFGGVALSGLVNNRRKFGTNVPAAVHMRHTHLKENYFVPGEGAHGADLADGPAAHRRAVRRRRTSPRASSSRSPARPACSCRRRVPQAPARDLRPARHPARVRRGDHRLRPHRATRSPRRASA